MRGSLHVNRVFPVSSSLEQRLADYRDPVLGDALPGCVQRSAMNAETIELDVELEFAAGRYADTLRSDLTQWLAPVLDGRNLQLNVNWQIGAQPVQGSLKPMPGIKNIIAVASGKGGVGKSTVAANLALALAAEGADVGMLDADIYGPSQPRMLGIPPGKPEIDGQLLVPPVGHGVHLMSIGLLVDVEEPTIWRGPMVTQALQQMLGETRWPKLDYLIIDLPPGTGDIQLSLSQRIPVSGAVVVTTPQDIALLDARKGLRMFQKVGVTILGIVENMSTHICTACGHEDAIFGSGGGAQMAQDYDVPLLGQLPLQTSIRLQADSGAPTMVDEADSPAGQAYAAMARRTAFALSRAGTAEFPEIVVE